MIQRINYRLLKTTGTILPALACLLASSNSFAIDGATFYSATISWMDASNVKQTLGYSSATTKACSNDSSNCLVYGISSPSAGRNAVYLKTRLKKVGTTELYESTLNWDYVNESHAWAEPDAYGDSTSGSNRIYTAYSNYSPSVNVGYDNSTSYEAYIAYQYSQGGTTYSRYFDFSTTKIY